MKKALKISLIAVACLVILIGGASAWLWFEYRQFVSSPAGETDKAVTLDIPANVSFNAVARQLQEAGVIADTFRFKLLSRLMGADKQLKAGEYQLSPAMTPPEVLHALVQGDVVLHRLTIPEGFTIHEIAAELQRTGLGDADAFTAQAFDPQVVKDLGFQADTLEGYLFPDTYFFPKGVTVKTIITRMVRQFQAQFSEQWRRRAEELGLSVHQVVTLASIIEKETGDSAERPMISSVFHNRLKKRMRLESDPTVIYGVDDFDGNITRRHLSAETRYNTYVIRGLPPGPIANPGRLSIEAALYPADTEYIFFVSKKDGTHYFSKTIDEHNQAIRKYQLRRRKN